MNKNPLISVIMPVYNSEKYLTESIESILNQTFKDFEFIIINDGSTDNSEGIILNYAKKDKRIIYLKNEENLGIVKTLNKGIKIAKGKYIARMDADDISLPERFEKQYKYMEKETNIGVCGTWIKIFGDKNGIWRMPVKHEEIMVTMLFNSCIMHPTVFIRKDILNFCNELYKEKYNKVEDYELWTRLIFKTRFANINKILLLYNMHNLSKHRKFYKNIQRDLSNKVRIEFLKRLGIKFSEGELKLHLKISNYDLDMYIYDIYILKNWFFKLINYNNKIGFSCNNTLIDILTDKLYMVCSYNLRLNKNKIWNIFFDFFKKTKNRNYNYLIKLFIKRFLRF